MLTYAGGHVSVKWDNATTEDCVFTGDEDQFLLILSTSETASFQALKEHAASSVPEHATVALSVASPRTMLCRNPRALIHSLKLQHAGEEGKTCPTGNSTEGKTCPTGNSTVGLILDKFKVAFVVPGSSAAKPREGSPLLKGDLIVAVDGVRTSGVP
jgi:hypothetical protein